MLVLEKPSCLYAIIQNKNKHRVSSHSYQSYSMSPLLSAVNNLPMGYPVLQPQILTTGQLHVDPMACGLSDYHVVNGIPAPGSSHPIRMNTGNE